MLKLLLLIVEVLEAQEDLEEEEPQEELPEEAQEDPHLEVQAVLEEEHLEEAQVQRLHK